MQIQSKDKLQKNVIAEQAIKKILKLSFFFNDVINK